MVTLDQLIAFHQVAASGTFAAAAHRLHKSQPAVSKLVQNLEAELGVVLFDRSAYRATLTDTGKLFFERVSQVLAQTRALESFGRALGRGGEPIVRLVIEAVTPLDPVLQALRDVQRLFPAVRYELRTERLAGPIEVLRELEADVAIASATGADPRSMIVRPFRVVRIIPVARRDHPLASAGAPVPAALLRAHAQVVVRGSARAELTQSFNVLEAGLRWTVTDIAAKLQIIEAGMGWGGLPEHVVAPMLADGSLVALDVREFELEAFELFVIKHADRPLGPVAEALWSQLVAITLSSWR